MPSARRFTIKGRVQGVFFRESARRVAESLGITGYANNRRDGNVEVFACGDNEALDRFADWLEQGPRMAFVTEVSAEEAEWQALHRFRTGYEGS